MKEADKLSERILNQLEIAFLVNNPHCEESQLLCKLHQKWIKMYWPTYSEEAHLGLVKMYTGDERFTSYYDKVAPGATAFLYQAMKSYLASN